MRAQIFEAMPFEFYSANGGEFGEYQESTPAFSNFEWEEESRGRSSSRRAGFSARTPRGGGRRFKRPLPPDRKRSKKPLHRVPCPPGRRPCPPRGIVGGPYGVVSEPYPLEPTFPTEPEPSGSEHVRWVQDCLNQTMGLQLQVTGVMGVETRSAVRSFQRQQGLRVSGIAGPDTQEALKAACTGRVAHTMGSGSGIGSTAEEIGETLSIGPTGELVEEEWTVPNNTRVTLTGDEPIILFSPAWESRLSTRPGIYFINEGPNIRYVGKATKSIRERIKDRFKAFRDFGIPEPTYYEWLRSNRTIVRSYAVTNSDTGIPTRYADTLGALEEYFIKMHGTRADPGRNRDKPPKVNFSAGGLKITYKGVRHNRNHNDMTLTAI